MNTDRLRRRAKAHHGRSNKHRWVVAFAAARVVGLRNGATKDMAEDLRVSEMTLTRYARAGLCYLDMARAFRREGSNIGVTRLQKARNDLGLKHFYVLYMYAKLNDMRLQDCAQELIEASENGVTTEEMMVHIYGEDGKPAPPTQWKNATTRQARGKYGQVGYTLTIYIDELFDDSPSYGTPVTLTEATDAAGRATRTETGA